MMRAKPGVLALLLFTVLLFSCKKEPKPSPAVDLTQVRLEDFQLEETPYTDIHITHPVIANGAEAQSGLIEVTVPAGAGLRLTPKPSNFTKTGFTISPGLGAPQDFLNKTILYTIRSTQNAAKAVRYTVRIREDQAAPVATEVTGFVLRKADNPFLPSDVASARIIHSQGTLGKIFVFVPAGTDFSALTARISFTGTGLFYSQDASASPDTSTLVYPANGKRIDFSYPKVFYAIVKNGAKTKAYDVIVDVKDPLKFAAASVSTANVPAGSIHFIPATTLVNVGNHPVSIINVDHSNPLPAGTSAIRGSAVIPSLGLLPKASTTVNATISAQTYPSGTYEVTAGFKPRLVGYKEADDLLQPTALRMKSTIVD